MTRRPPKIARWILCRFRSQSAHESLIGDYDEIFQNYYNEHGFRNATIWYWCQILKALPSFCKNSIRWRIVMFQNYLKIALRNLFKHKVYSLINIVGLAVGITCCLLILLYVRREQTIPKALNI